MAKTSLFNIQIDVMNREESIMKCKEFLDSGKCHTLFFLNAHCFNIAQKNHVYRDILNNASLLLNDGIGIKIASFLAGVKLKANMNGTDFIPELLNYAAKNRVRIFFLGGKPGICEKARIICEKRFPGIEISGTSHGYFKLEEEEALIRKINDAGTDILIVGMGVPKQELWLSEHHRQLPYTKICIAAGAIFDFLSGRVKRAPVWMRKLGSEWIFRMMLEPKRLLPRYTIGNYQFIKIIIQFYFNKLKKKDADQ